MANFKIGDWDESKASKKACTSFMKGETLATKVKNELKAKRKKAKKSVLKKTGDNKSNEATTKLKTNSIVKAKTKFQDAKKTKQKAKTKTVTTDKNNIPRKDVSINSEQKPQKRNKAKKKKEKAKTAPVIIPVTFNRKTLNNPILSTRKQNKEKSLRERMIEKLNAARFRFLNEEIYVQDGKQAESLFKRDRDAFQTYHTGYKLQVEKWPMNPLDVIIEDVNKLSKSFVIADLGCGEGRLSQSVQQKVHSFDLVALNKHVTVCNMDSIPLDANSVDVVVFCLSLMGTNLQDYIKEANRILKVGGIMKIAEVESRFDKVESFIKGVEYFGFKKISMNLSHNLFYFMDFKKVSKCKAGAKQSTLMLKPCLYKKR